MPIGFQLYMQVNHDTVHYYPYVGVNNETSRIINICEANIEISERDDNLFHEPDYLPTSRSFEFDLVNLDQLVKAYIGPLDYRIIVRFNEYQHITLTYHSPTNEAPKDYDIFSGYPDKRALQLIKDIYPLMEAVKQTVLLVE